MEPPYALASSASIPESSSSSSSSPQTNATMPAQVVGELPPPPPAPLPLSMAVIDAIARNASLPARRRRGDGGGRRSTAATKRNRNRGDDPESREADGQAVDGALIPVGDGRNMRGVGAGGGGGRVMEEIRLPCLSHGVSSLIGRRREMEDTVMVALWFAADTEGIGGEGGEGAVVVPAAAKYDFFGVYDGHGGVWVAEACRDRLHLVLAEEMAGGWPRAEGRWREAMTASFLRVDEEMKAVLEGDEERTIGSTAVVAVVGADCIVVGNCGDSRAVLSRDGHAVALSTDHKPERPDELERVEAAGGKVIHWDGYRVLGVLATSRSIGDFYLKPYVIPEPEVTVTARTDKDEFLILASDGLWDVMSNEAACRVARRCLNGELTRFFRNAGIRNTATDAAALLTALALSRGSGDNISVLVVQLKKFDEAA